MDEANKLELHYYFDDLSHSMDAFTRNKCEAEILSILSEAADILKIPVTINSEVYQEGGLKEFWKLLGQNNTQITILLVVVTIVLSRIPIVDQEADALEKELKRLSIEEKKLNIEKLKRELGKDISEVNTKTVVKAAKHVDKNLKVVKRKSNFYAHLACYPKVTKIGFAPVKNNWEHFSDERLVERADFNKFILSTNKLESETDDSAEIEIISPVLKEGRYRWKGIYQDSIITFEMNDCEFKEQVLMEQISFKHGSKICCELRVSRELNEVGDVKITGYTVITVIELIENGVPVPTNQGKRFKQAKKFENSQGDLFS